MRYRIPINLIGAIVVSVLAACSAGKVIVSHQQLAGQYVAEGNYNAATDEWVKYFEQQALKQIEVPGLEFEKAAGIATKAERLDLAEQWFEKALESGVSDSEMLLQMASIYRSKGNNYDEKEVLERFRKLYSSDEKMAEINFRLFTIYTGWEDAENALAIWPSLTDAQKGEKQNLQNYFNLILRKDDAAEKERTAQRLLDVDPVNVKALELLGEIYYRRAEDSYQAEMAAYKKKHTHMQYLHLTQELKVINANFQRSLDCFTKLWEIEQKAGYAAYLSNIYARFENKQKADYYRKFVK